MAIYFAEATISCRQRAFNMVFLPTNYRQIDLSAVRRSKILQSVTCMDPRLDAYCILGGCSSTWSFVDYRTSPFIPMLFYQSYVHDNFWCRPMNILRHILDAICQCQKPFPSYGHISHFHWSFFIPRNQFLVFLKSCLLWLLIWNELSLN